MSRFRDHTEMSADDVRACAADAMAILQLCERAAYQMQGLENAAEVNLIGGAIEQASQLAVDLMGPVVDYLSDAADASEAG